MMNAPRQPLLIPATPVQRYAPADTSPVESWTQGADRVVNAMIEANERKVKRNMDRSAPYKLGGEFPKAPSMGANFLAAAKGFFGG